MASTGSLKELVYLSQHQYNEITTKDVNTVYITPTDNYGGVIGVAGATFLPVVDANGNIGWSNNGSLPNPTTRNIKGAVGATPAIAMAVKTLTAGETVSIEKSGTNEAPHFTLGIPRGSTALTISVDSTKTLEANQEASVINVGDDKDIRYQFGIPQGADGVDGDKGEQGQTGATIYTGLDVPETALGIDGDLFFHKTSKDYTLNKTVSTALSGRFGNQQNFIIPFTAQFKINALGASGSMGNVSNTALRPRGGYGASIESYFSLNKGDELIFYIGQAGSTIQPSSSTNDGTSGGGGGATIVLKKIPSITDSRYQFTKNGISYEVLLVAAGGGGTPDIGYRGTNTQGVDGIGATAYHPSHYINGITSAAGIIYKLIHGSIDGLTYARGGAQADGGYGGGQAMDDDAAPAGSWLNNNSWSLNTTFVGVNAMSQGEGSAMISGTGNASEVMSIYNKVNGAWVSVGDYPYVKGADGLPGKKGDAGDPGKKGEKGDAAFTVAVGTTETLLPTQTAYVNSSGTAQDPILNFGIPKGDQGVKGLSAFEYAVAGGYTKTEVAFQNEMAKFVYYDGSASTGVIWRGTQAAYDAFSLAQKTAILLAVIV